MDTFASQDIIRFLDKKKFVYIWGTKLPHWFQENKAVFITFRLADSLPQTKINELLDMKMKMLGNNSNDDNTLYNEEVVKRMEEWIDAGYGNCILKNPDIRRIVAESIHFFDGKHYALHSYVIMPNHVHILLSPLGGTPVLDYVGEIKRFTSVRINKMLGKVGKVWQKGIFDRLVRDSIEFERYWNYIVENPRYLSVDFYTLYTKNSML